MSQYQCLCLIRLRSIIALTLATVFLLPPISSLAQEGVRQHPDREGWVRIAKPHRYADVLLDTDSYSGAYTLTPAAADLGKSARLVLVARVDSRWYSHDGAHWQPWNSGRMNELRTYATRVLQATESLSFLNDERLFAGDYAVLAGYQIGSGPIIYNQRALEFTVQASTSDALIPFASDTSMEAYLKEGLANGATASQFATFDRAVTLATTAVAASAPASGTAQAATATRTSATNLQELGVDEADTIKVDGSNLYMLAACDNKPCLQLHTLDSAGAKATLGASLTLGSAAAPSGMFMVDKGIQGQKKVLVTVGGQNGSAGWFRIWSWQSNKTELEFIGLATPAAPKSLEKLTLDGSLVASRRVGNMLYVVTRFTPGVPDLILYATDKAAIARNTEVLAKTTLPAILPNIEDSRKKTEDLVKSKSCYLATSAVDGNFNPSIITITSIPLDAPANHASTCFLGGSETLYMSTESLYLATTSWKYNEVAADRSAIFYSPNHTTAIHKFALNAGKIEYRGSGEVKGHLGWEQDKKSFRMGENKGYLNVASSIGDSWNGTSSTRLTVLKETAGSKNLQTVRTIDGIGLKGEQLYAARFLGDRGYLVTFRVTDPLYVLDLSNQEQPRITGELKISGYSDYLHPVSDKLLLGIGKDAIPDTRSSDENGRGAWYQGVKLSLFDVSNINAPKEINSLVLGKRGTSSEVLYDHHALSFLPALGSEPARLAIPLVLHDTVPTSANFRPTEPSAWYDYTHTALYSFEIGQLGITRVGRLVSELPTVRQSSSPAVGILPIGPIVPAGVSYGDRSVLQADAVYYIHAGKVLSSKWGESK